MNWELIVWTLVLLLPLLWLVRNAHQGLQELFYLLTEHKAVAVYLFQIMLLPGVILHEMSHYVAAKLLGVRIRKLSLQPQIRGNKIQMGAIVMDRPDFARGILIGLAPLVVGTAVVVLIGYHVFDVANVIAAVTANDIGAAIGAVQAAFGVNDAWIWFYFIFAISNAMLPSESDRASLWPMLIFVGAIAVVVALAGWGPAVLVQLVTPMESAFSLLLVAFGITLFVDLIFVSFIALLRALVTALTGRRLEKQL
jgi:hypothetical protein